MTPGDESLYRARKMYLARLGGARKVAEWMRIYGGRDRAVTQVPRTRTGEIAYDRMVGQILDAEFPGAP